LKSSVPRTSKKTGDKKRSTTSRQLEKILEDLMLEVAVTHPAMGVRGTGGHNTSDYDGDADRRKSWAHMTARFVSEVVKRKDMSSDELIPRARRAVRRRIQRDLADSYLRMDLPKWEEAVPGQSAETDSDEAV